MTTLLYVDDEETIGRVVSRFFTRRGDAVFVAHTIAEAVEILAVETPAAVFIDVWLGKESGFELMNWIDDVRPELADRVTFVTGELVEHGSGASAWKKLGRPVLQKPFALATLAECLDHAESRAGT